MFFVSVKGSHICFRLQEQDALFFIIIQVQDPGPCQVIK